MQEMDCSTLPGKETQMSCRLLRGDNKMHRVESNTYCHGKLPQKQYSLKVDKMFNFKTVKDEKEHI